MNTRTIRVKSKDGTRNIRADIIDYVDDTGAHFSRGFTPRGQMYRVAYRDVMGPVWVKEGSK